MATKFITLNSGKLMPIIGFGTWQATDAELEAAVDKALEAGYRHIDTAYVYENEAAIGRTLHKWLSSGKINRNDLFIVTKLPPGGNRPQSVEKYLIKSLANLQLDYVDQYLVHTPFTFKEIEGELHPHDENGEMAWENTDHLAVWKEMEKQVDEGRALTIGISNFNERQIERILQNARIKPAALQVEVNLYFQQKPLVDFCKKHNLPVVAYSPLGSMGLQEMLKKMGVDKPIQNILENEVVKEIASKHNKTPAQIVLRHIIQRGVAAIPKSTNPTRLRQNLDVFSFELDDDDMSKLNAEDKGPAARVCDFGFLKGINKHPEFPF